MLPEGLRGFMENTALMAPEMYFTEPIGFDVAELRRAVRQRMKVRFRYTDVLSQGSERTVRPLSLAYFGPVWVLAAWCELRVDFRTFRLDRMRDFAVTDERFRAEAGRTLHDFLKRSRTWTRSARPRIPRRPERRRPDE